MFKVILIGKPIFIERSSLSPNACNRPTNSLQLNPIEIVWRFMKYEWIELNADESLDKLAAYIEKALKGFGKGYIVNFA